MKPLAAEWTDTGTAGPSATGSAVVQWLARRDVTIAVVAMLFVAQAAIRFGSHLGPDIAWYLYAGGRLLDGGLLYKDIVEANPPLGIWLAMLVAAAARATGVGSTVLLKAVLLALTALSVGLSARLMTAATDISASARHLIVILIAALLLFLPGADFGQRDHVMVLLVCPWVLLRWNRLIDRDVPFALASAVGLLAATGFWLKPHFLFAFLSIELSIALATRSARPLVHIETLGVVAFGAAYLIAMSSLFPRDLVAMSSMSTKAFIPFYGQSVEAIAPNLILPLMLMVLAIVGTRLLSEQLQLLRTLLLAAGAACLFIVMVQAGYRYQLMPAVLFLGLAVGIGVARQLAGEVGGAGPGQRIVVIASAIAVAAAFVPAALMQFVPYRGEPFERAIAEEAPEARSIFIASTSSSHPFPLVEERGLVWASRFPSQWLLPFAATTLDERGVPIDGVGQFVLEATVSDIIAYAPDIVFIDERPERPDFRGSPLDYISFWNRDVRFPIPWKAYERRGVADGFGVYVRRDPAAKQ